MFESVYYKFPLFFRHTVYTPLSTKIVRHHQGHGKAVLNNRCSGNFREKQANATVDVTLSRDRSSNLRPPQYTCTAIVPWKRGGIRTT